MTASASDSVKVDRRGAGPTSSLTPRQYEALRLLACGLTYAEAAAVMVISLQSYKNHVHSAYKRLDVGGIVQAMIVLGWVRV